MTVFVDTSGLYAALDRDDANHGRAREVWEGLLRSGAGLVTTNYVLLETAALVQHRMGVRALRVLEEDAAPMLKVEWVTEEMHRAGVGAVLAAGRRKLSVVDCVSFQTMRRLGVRVVFGFDGHFGEQGFEMAPGAEGGEGEEYSPG